MKAKSTVKAKRSVETNANGVGSRDWLGSLQTRLPQIQVLIFEPELTHSVWSDYWPRARTMKGLMRELRTEIKAGRFVGYRFLTIHEEHLGLPSAESRDRRP